MILCWHKWKVIGKMDFIDPSFGWTKYHLQCEKCGNLKDVSLLGHVETLKCPNVNGNNGELYAEVKNDQR